MAEGVRVSPGWPQVVLAGAFGAAVGLLSLYAFAYSSVRFGGPDGATGTARGYLALLLPILGVALCMLLSGRLPAVAWAGGCAAAGLVLFLLPFPPSVDCGDNVRGFTCPGITTGPG